MDVKYSKPPLKEAVCEVFFTPNGEWDLTYPAEFYNKIKNEFPEKKTKTEQGIGFAINNAGINIGANNRRQTLQCFNTDKNMLVQISENMLAVNSLPPYIEWEQYKELITKQLNIYKELFAPKEIARITLRYINKVDIGEVCDYENLKKYFHFSPNIPNIENSNANSIATNVEIPQKDNNILAAALATLRSENGMKSPVLLDISFVKIKRFEIDTIDQWLDNAHNTVKNFFLSAVTEEAIKSFE